VGSIAAGYGQSYVLRVLIIAALLIINVGLYFAAFRVLTPEEIETKALAPGSVLGGVGFTLLITVGAGLVQHQLRHLRGVRVGHRRCHLPASPGQVEHYAAELNPVLARSLWPRALPTCEPTDADNQVLHELAHQQPRRPDQGVGVGFDPNSPEVATVDARQADDAKQPEV
jgi:hypothetical protein